MSDTIIDTCNSPSCHEERMLVAKDVKDLNEFVDTQKTFNDNIRRCFREYIRRPSIALISLICILIFVPLGATGVKVWFTSNTVDLVYARNDTVNAQEKRIVILESEVKNMNSKLDDLKITASENKKETKEGIAETKEGIAELKELLIDHMVKPTKSINVKSQGE